MCVCVCRGRGEEGEDKNERRTEELEEGRVLMLVTVIQCTHIVHMRTTWHKTLVLTSVKPRLHVLTRDRLIQIWLNA